MDLRKPRQGKLSEEGEYNDFMRLRDALERIPLKAYIVIL